MNLQVQNQLLTIIGTAITGQRVIQIKHNNVWRTVEPYIAGINKDTQTACIYGFCRDVIPSHYTDKSSRWQLFRFSDIENIELTYYEFRPHTEYTGNYENIYPVYVKLNPKAVTSR